MSRKWITADTHFGHKGIIKHCHRPFVNNAYPETDERHWDSDAMDEFLIQKWNEVVRPNDLVYHLGDVGYHCPAAKLKAIRVRLHGKIFLVPGNHDKEALLVPECWTVIPNCTEIFIKGKPSRQRVVLAHYAMRVWNRSHKGSWHLYGHSHGQLPEIPTSLSFDVGVDCTGYRPISEEEIAERMQVKIALRAEQRGRVRDTEGFWEAGDDE